VTQQRHLAAKINIATIGYKIHHLCNLSPFKPSQLLLATLKQDDFMLAGSTFHHLYSYPRTGSVPAGQDWHATDATQYMFNIFGYVIKMMCMLLK